MTEVLWLNWRDLRHPRAGGAEVYTHEVARRLVERGHPVTLVAGHARGLPRAEVIDGVRVLRGGGQVTTRAWAAARFGRAGRARPWVVVEEINTIPYWARWWSGSPTLLCVHQLAREVWWSEAPWLLAPAGHALEPAALRAARAPAVALSESTRDDLVEVGFRPEEVRVVWPGIPQLPPPPGAGRRDPHLLVAVGRITPSKGMADLIEALARVRASGLPARLAIVGRGSDRELARLQGLARARGVAGEVTFPGYLGPEGKRALLARSAALVMASAREGWGLVVTEANAVGTPAVVYRRPGLVDSTRHMETGLVTDPDPVALAAGIGRLLRDPALRDRLGAAGRDWSRALTWDRTAEGFASVLEMVAAGRRDIAAPGGDGPGA